MVFQVGDKVAYPMHGAGVIEGIEEKCILGEAHNYYVLRLSLGNVQILIPTGNMDESGVRYIVSDQEADTVIRSLYEDGVEEDENWNKRYRENIEKLRHGALTEVAWVTKALLLRDRRKSLSNAERNMLGYAKTALVSEIMLSKHMSYDEVMQMLADAIS